HHGAQPTLDLRRSRRTARPTPTGTVHSTQELLTHFTIDAPLSIGASAQRATTPGGSTRMVMTARTTSDPLRSTALTGTATFCASPHSVLSRRAVAVTSDSARRRYSIVMPRLCHVIPGGKVTSVTVLAASSHK